MSPSAFRTLPHPQGAYQPDADDARNQLAEELARAEYAQARPNPLLGDNTVTNSKMQVVLDGSYR